MNELINIFYLQKYVFLNCFCVFFFFYYFTLFNVWFKMQTNSPKPNKTKCSPVFVKGNKSWCVFMAFSCKTGSIDRAGRHGSRFRAAFAGLQVWLSVRLEIIFSTDVFGFHLPLCNFPFEYVCQCRCGLCSYEAFEIGQVRRRRWWVGNGGVQTGVT